MLTREQRVKKFYRQLELADPASGHDEAFELVSRTLNEVENAHSGIPYDPTTQGRDGRLYPPQADSEVSSPVDGFRAYRTRGHTVLIGDQGQIRIIRGPKGGPHELEFQKDGSASTKQ